MYIYNVKLELVIDWYPSTQAANAITPFFEGERLCYVPEDRGEVYTDIFRGFAILESVDFFDLFVSSPSQAKPSQAKLSQAKPKQSKTPHDKAKQAKAKKRKVKYSKANQSKAKQCNAKQREAKQTNTNSATQSKAR